MQIYLTMELSESLLAYRRQRKLERGGRMITNQVAVVELLEKALHGIKPAEEMTVEKIEKRFSDLENRLYDLETQLDKDP